jgi:hypothetical protein
MQRGTALDIAQRFFARGKPLPSGLREEIIGTQMQPPPVPTCEATFVGWTTDEKIAFYARGVVPQRYRT